MSACKRWYWICNSDNFHFFRVSRNLQNACRADSSSSTPVRRAQYTLVVLFSYVLRIILGFVLGGGWACGRGLPEFSTVPEEFHVVFLPARVPTQLRVLCACLFAQLLRRRPAKSHLALSPQLGAVDLKPRSSVAVLRHVALPLECSSALPHTGVGSLNLLGVRQSASRRPARSGSWPGWCPRCSTKTDTARGGGVALFRIKKAS